MGVFATELTLSTDAAIPRDTDSFAHPVLRLSDVPVLSTVSVLFLPFVHDRVVLGGD